jgi:hypothetical protein
MRNYVWLAALTAALCVASIQLVSPAHAQVKVETVVEGLDNPSGIAIQPETGDVFVSDSGALRVVRITGGKVEEVITGFTKDVYGKGPMYDIGPLGLAFLNKDTLVVGDGGKIDGEELLRVYEVPPAGKSIKADDMVASFSLPAKDPGTPTAVLGEGNFYALAVIGDAIYATSNGDDTKGWVNRAMTKDGKVVSYERYLATKEAVGVDAPVGIAVQPQANNLVVGQMGEITVPNDSLLTFYNPKDGKLIMNLPTGLFDITGLAYGPKGQLYATDFAWMDTTEGGLFQLVAAREGTKQVIQAKKLAPLDKPTALAFGKDGTLYITVIGTAEGDKKGGKLLKIAPGL